MTIRTAILASLLLVSTGGLASAQNTMSPGNQSRPGLQGDDSSKPNGLQNNAGTGLPANAGTTPSAPSTVGTSGAGTMGAGSNARSSDTNVSPASPRAGEQQPAK